MQTRPESFILAAANLAVAGLLVWSSWPHSRNYYILLRFAVCVVAVVELYIRKREWPAFILIGGIIVLFNPFMPFNLAKATWTIIDLAVAILFIFAGIAHLDIRDSLLGGIALLALSGFLVVFAGYGVMSAVRLSEGRQTEGEVTEITEDMVDGGDSHPDALTYKATYQFVLPGGKVVMGTSEYWGNVGDKVPIIYNPNDPEENELTDDRRAGVSRSLFNLVMLSFVAFLIGSHGVSKIRAREHVSM